MVQTKKHSLDTVTDTQLALDNKLCFALYSASLAMTQAYRPLLKPLGLTYPQYIVMLSLWERDGVTVGELGNHVNLDSGTLTPLLKRLELQNILVRQRSSIDERQVIVLLTSVGEKMRRAALKVNSQLSCKVEIEPQTAQHLLRQITLLRQNLCKIAE